MQRDFEPDRTDWTKSARKRAKLNKLGPKLISKIVMAEKYTLTPLRAYFICVKRIYQSKVMHISRFETKSGNRFKADRKNVKLRSNRKTFTNCKFGYSYSTCLELSNHSLFGSNRVTVWKIWPKQTSNPNLELNSKTDCSWYKNLNSVPICSTLAITSINILIVCV